VSNISRPNVFLLEGRGLFNITVILTMIAIKRNAGK
jgi:hypothetical protein